jgi:hypothetical protein
LQGAKEGVFGSRKIPSHLGHIEENRVCPSQKAVEILVEAG